MMDVSLGVIECFDELLSNETQFGRYIDEHRKVFAYQELILAHTVFMNGNPRPLMDSSRGFLLAIEVIKDIHARRFRAQIDGARCRKGSGLMLELWVTFK